KDLFRPDEKSFVESVASTFSGIEQWNVYASENGVTVRGISSTKKIKVVVAIPVSMKDGKAVVKGAGYLKASDFDLPTDSNEAMRTLAGALAIDLGTSSSSGVQPQDLKQTACSYVRLVQVVAGSLAAGSWFYVMDACADLRPA